MRATRNPLFLTTRPVTITHIQSGGEVCALVQVDKNQRPHCSYDILVYDQYARAMFERSPFYGIIPYRTFELGLLVHEVSHVLKGTMDIDFPLENWIAEYIDNILADDADEYNLMKLFPDYARYTQLVLACLKWDTPYSIGGSSLENDLTTLFFLTRFGVIKAGADAEFASFALPLVLSSRRGGRHNTINAGLALYEYLYQKNQQSNAGKQAWQSAMMTDWQTQVPLTAADVEAIASGMQVSSSGSFDTVQQANSTQGLDAGKYAGLSGPPPDDAETDDEFFTTTCGLYAKTIIELENVFLMRKHTVLRVYAPEGELHPRRRHRAMKDALMGEEKYNYVGLKRVDPSIDVVICRDISGSTDDIKTEYARSAICFLAALENKRGIRTGMIDFNSQFEVLMRFGDPVSKTRIRPAAGGGTDLYPALLEVKGWQWIAHEKFLFIITDGWIARWGDTCVPFLYSEFVTKGITVVVVEIVTDEKQTEIQGEARDFPGSFASTIQRLPAKLMNVLTGGGL